MMMKNQEISTLQIPAQSTVNVQSTVNDPYSDPTRKGGSIQTFTGQILYPLDPRIEEIHLVDVAHSMGNKARFTGHTKVFYSSGEHAVRVSWHVRDTGGSIMQQYVALHHDDSDYCLPDVPTPLKVLPEFAWFRELEHLHQDLCYKRFGCIVDDYSVIKRSDVVLLLTEKRDLMSKKNANWGHKYTEKPIPKPYKISPWSPRKAKTEYLRRHRELYNAILQS